MKKYSTDNSNHEKFRPHGRVEFQFYDEGIILFNAYGPFNEELVEAIEEVQPELLYKLKDAGLETWADVVLFHNSCMVTEEGLKKLSNYLQKLQSSSIASSLVAFILPKNVEGASYMANEYKKIYNKAGITFQSFENKEDAFAWVKETL